MLKWTDPSLTVMTSISPILEKCLMSTSEYNKDRHNLHLNAVLNKTVSIRPTSSYDVC